MKIVERGNGVKVTTDRIDARLEWGEFRHVVDRAALASRPADEFGSVAAMEEAVSDLFRDQAYWYVNAKVNAAASPDVARRAMNALSVDAGGRLEAFREEYEGVRSKADAPERWEGLDKLWESHGPAIMAAAGLEKGGA